MYHHEKANPIYNTAGNNPNSISENEITALRQTNQSNLWAGTLNGGVNIIIPDRENNSFHNSENGLSI